MRILSRQTLVKAVEAHIELIKRRAWDDFYIFAKLVCGNDLMEEVPHRELCEFITLGLDKSELLDLNFNPPVSTEYVKKCQGRLKKLIMLARGTFKSSIVTKCLPIWLLWHNPNLRVMIDSEVLGNAKKYLTAIKDLIENSEMLKLICVDEQGNYVLEGNYKMAGGWTDEQIVLKSRTKMGLKEPSIFCAGVDNAQTGMHPDVIIMDDLVSERNVGTAGQIEKVKDHYKFSLSLLEPGGLQVVIGTRYHMADLYGDLLEIDTFDTMIRPAITPDGELYFPSRLTREFLDNMRKEQGSYIFNCNPKGAPVLMADWTFKDVSEIQVGDMVMGFIRGGEGRANARAKLVPTKVMAVRGRVAEVQRVVFENGTEIRCTPDHNWFTGRYASKKEPTRQAYLPARIGGKLLNVTQAWRDELTQEDMLNYAYLSAMIDGECAVKYGSITLSQDVKLHPNVCSKIEEVLTKLKIPYTVVDYRETHKFYTLKGGRDTKIRLLNYGMMGKQDDVVRNLYNNNSRPTLSKDRVVDIIPDGEEMVYSFQTGTGNYIIWGYMSKNCQYLLSPLDDSNAVFKKEHIKYYDKLPPIVERHILIDLAISQKETADYTVIMCVGVTADKKIYVIEYVRDRLTPDQTIDEIFNMYERHKIHGNVRTVGIETVAFQKAMVYFIRNEMRRRGVYLPLKELKADRDKNRRIGALQPLFENGDVYMKNTHKELENELLEFPFSEHDDSCDCLAYILQVLRPVDYRPQKYDYTYKPGNKITNY